MLLETYNLKDDQMRAVPATPAILAEALAKSLLLPSSSNHGDFLLEIFLM